jgi:hypothetical protein
MLACRWDEISVHVAEKDVQNLDTILTAIKPEEIMAMQRKMWKPEVRTAMLFPQPAEPGDSFHQILNGLARKLPHKPEVFLKPGEHPIDWTAGPPQDQDEWRGDDES